MKYRLNSHVEKCPVCGGAMIRGRPNCGVACSMEVRLVSEQHNTLDNYNGGETNGRSIT